MDTQQKWQVFSANEESNRKRPWDVISSSTSAETTVPRSYINTFSDERESTHSLEWKRRRSIVQTEPANIWDATMQTGLWLAQQNNLEPVSQERNAPATLARLSEQEYRNRLQGPPEPPRDWNRYADDVHKGSVEGRALGTRLSSVQERPITQYEHPHQSATLPVVPEKHDVAQRGKPSMLPGIETRCDKCHQDEPLWRESVNYVGKLIESVTAGSMFEIIAQYRREGIRHELTPLVAELHRAFELMQEASGLARLVLQTAPSYLQDEKETSPNVPQHANGLQSSLENMKRRFLTDSQDDVKRQRRDSVDVSYGHEAHSYLSMVHEPASADGYGRIPTADTSGDRLPPIRTQTPSQVSPDGFSSRLPSMKPPPTPSRQLPSPPGRSHPSPPSYNIPSPSSLLYGPQSAGSNAAPQQQALATITHPLSPTPSSSVGIGASTTTALQTHTAALQHEVSVKKYALQTLQSEHDKLLAALRRSQTRAHTLEEKQVNSDLEVNTLSEERVRLLAQITELEQTITEVSKTRDEFRQAAVKEGAQYVKIVRMASRLEMMAGDERKEWKRQMTESKAKIEALQASLQQAGGSSLVKSSIEVRAVYEGSVEELKAEAHRLRSRCVELEDALKMIRTEGQHFREAIATLGSAGGHIVASVDAALTSSPPQFARSV